MHYISEADLLAMAKSIVVGFGTPDDLAQNVAESLVWANMAGHDSHGVMLLNLYKAVVDRGQVKPANRAAIKTKSAATAIIDANWGWGHPAGRLAADTAIDLARTYGVGAVTIERCNHIARQGEYVERMAAAGMAGIAVCNSGPGVAPFQGRERLLGTNPFSFAVPAGEGNPPVLADFATSGVAEGKIRVAMAKGEQLAPGLLLNKDGEPTRAPEDMEAGGTLLGFGLHKGYGIGVMAELLGGVLSRMGASSNPGYYRGNGVMMLALKIDSFMPLAQFEAETDALAVKLRTSQPAAGHTEVLVPGDPETRARHKRGAEGIPIPDASWANLVQLAESQRK